MAFDAELALMKHAAIEAGKALVADFNRRDELLVSFKKPGDLVSNADRNSEATIIAILRSRFPNYAVLGEEGGAESGIDNSCRWIIDPLDGTGNFLHGFPHWCVTIALEKEGVVVAGVTYDPLRDEMFTAIRNEGAFLNGVPLRVTNCTTIGNAMMVVDSALQDMISAKAYRELMVLFEDEGRARLRLLGAVALDLAYVAAGRFDAYYFQGGAQQWDVAAGYLLAEEAGAMVTDLTLQPAHHTRGEVLAANSILHQKIVELIGV